ncbi:MAG: hypothetical protein GDA36_07970 [Rhodobacteraceae bacterium]|nr:hypothetical protein [Paracoccaceae bacterium]
MLQSIKVAAVLGVVATLAACTGNSNGSSANGGSGGFLNRLLNPNQGDSDGQENELNGQQQSLSREPAPTGKYE